MRARERFALLHTTAHLCKLLLLVFAKSTSVSLFWCANGYSCFGAPAGAAVLELLSWLYQICS